MLSASRSLVVVTALVATASGVLLAQEFPGFRSRRPPPVIELGQAEYDGRFVFTRLRYGPPDLRSMRREPPWAHDFPRADFNFTKIMAEITFARTFMDQGNVRMLDDPDLAMFPVAYMSEPGFWTMNDAEAEGFRAYLQKGGFVIFDDFREDHRDNLVHQMRRVLPDARWVPLDASHPIFHSFFEIDSLEVEGYYGMTEWTGIFEDNDPARRLLAVANYNHDLGELWEYSDTGYVPVDLSNEAYKFGVNYVMYALTH